MLVERRQLDCCIWNTVTVLGISTPRWMSVLIHKGYSSWTFRLTTNRSIACRLCFGQGDRTQHDVLISTNASLR